MKYHYRSIIGFLVCLAVVWVACEPGSGSRRATLYRDTYGVPHIYAEWEAAAAYAHGYAQAEDRLEQVLRNYRWAEGTLAEAVGKDALDEDYFKRVWRHAEVCREKYQEISPKIRVQLEAFVTGIEAYMTEHPERVPEWAPEIHPWHPIALGRAFIWGWPAGQAWGDLNRKHPKPKSKTRGSNQWVLAGSRTASGAPMALIDPHLSWNEGGHWSEVRIHAGDLHVAGMVIPGIPFIALGHTRYVSWAATTGGPDCGDIYVEQTDPGNRLRYRYDNEWRVMTVDTIKLGYRENDQIEYETRTVEHSHHGPIVKRQGTKAYAMAIPYENEVSLIETVWRMNIAKSVDDMREALAMQQMLPQNWMVADVHGNIYYQRTGRVPIRPAGYDFHYPVPGNSSKSEWQGIHPTNDLVQILNPEADYMQNCNISPGTMIHAGAPKKSHYPDYIFNDRQNRGNPRGRRAVALLKDASKVDVEIAMGIVFDTTVDSMAVAPWQRALKLAFDRNRTSRYRSMQSAVNVIVNWDRSLSAENTTARLYLAWRQEVDKARKVQLKDVQQNPSALSIAKQKALLDALSKAVKYMKKIYRKIEVPWGETYRLGRGDKDFPIGGSSGGRLGLSTLRNVWSGEDFENGVRVASGGQSCPMLVVLTDPIESYSVLPWGESDDPESPHFTDQMELFSHQQMKPTWFQRKELEGNISSERTLEMTVDD